MNLFWFERALRAALGAVMITFGFVTGVTLILVVGCVLLATGAAGYCPLVTAFRLTHAGDAQPAPQPASQPAPAKRLA